MNDETPQTRPVRRRRGLRRARSGLTVLLSLIVMTVGLPLLVLALTGAPVQAPLWLAQRVETQMNDRIGTGRVSLERIDLRVDRNLRPRVQMRNVGVYDDRGTEVARLNQVRARLDAAELVRGAVRLRALTVSGAQITVRRRTDGTFALSFGAGNAGASGTLAGVLDGLDQVFATAPLSTLDSIAANELTITLEDSRSGRLWQATDGRIVLEQTETSLDLTVSADVFNGTEELATTVIGFRTQKGSPQASLTATFRNAAAVDIAAQSPALSFLSVLDAPISGALRASIDASGQIEGLAGTLEVGQGALQPTPDTPPIGFDSGRAYVAYDPKKQAVTFSQVTIKSDAASVTAEGTALLKEFADGWPGALIGQFALSDAMLQPKGLFAEPMEFRRGAVDFRLRLDPFEVDIGQVALSDGDRRFNGRGRVRTDAAGWNVALDVDLNTIPLDRALALWPVAVAPGTRAWLGRNVLSGDISDLTGAFRLSTGAPPEVSLNYVYSGATVRALATLPAIENAAGYASLSNKAYTMIVEKGDVTAPMGGPIDVAGSVFRIADVTQRVSRAQLVLQTDSTITAALSLLDLPPFQFMSKAGLPVDLAQGRAQVRSEISFPVQRVITLSDISHSVTGTLTDVDSDTLIKGRNVHAAQLELRADPGGISISGPGELGAVPVNVTWSQVFGPENRGISRVEGTVELSQAFLDEFNISLPPGSVEGRGVAQLVVDLVKGEAPRFALSSDLNRMRLSLRALDWSKPANRTGRLEIAGRLGDLPAIDRLRLDAPGLQASGVVDLAPGGTLQSAQFDRVRVGNWLDGPVTLTGRGRNASPAIAVNGGSIDLRAAAFGAGDGDGGPLSLTLDRLTVSEGITLTGFAGTFKAGAGLDGRFTALVNGQAPIQGTVLPTPSGTAIRLVSDRAGLVLEAADILRNARGGDMDLTLNPTGAAGVYDGRLKILGTRITKAPALTELLSAISIIGLLDQMNSGGITLSEVDAEFNLGPDRLTLYSSSAVGPSLGISLDGIYDLKNSRMDMQGVLSPVYFLNGMGQIFSRRGEGLFGFNFRLSGAAKDPRVSVNPLSILTPGAFREIFRRAPPQPAPSQ